MTTEMAILLAVISAVCAFTFLRVIKLEFEVARLKHLVDYLMNRGYE